MQKQGFTATKNLESFRSLTRADYTPPAKPSFSSIAISDEGTAEKPVKDQASVKTDLEIAHAVNENVKLEIKHKEDAKLWLGLDSKHSSTNSMRSADGDSRNGIKIDTTQEHAMRIAQQVPFTAQFDEAIAFVLRIKNRFAGKPSVNGVFMKILGLYKSLKSWRARSVNELIESNQKLEELESEIDRLKVALNEEKQLHLASVEREKQLEDQNSKIQASLITTESQLIEAKRQYDTMLEVKKLELSKYLKDLCQKNDQAINEIRKKYESEKVEVINMEKEKAENLVRELERKYEEKLAQSKADAQENLIRVKEENITTISRLQKEFNEELSIHTHHKEELHRLELRAENELRDRLSALRKQHEFQMKSLNMQHEDDWRKLQEELEIQKSKEEKQRALLQLQWKVMGENQQGEQEVHSKKRRECHAGREHQHSMIISPEAKRKDLNLPTILQSPMTSIMRKDRKMTHHNYEVEVETNCATKTKRARSSSAMLAEPNGTQKLAFNKTPNVRKDISKLSKAPSVVGGTQQRPAIGELFSEGSLNPYADDDPSESD